MKLAAKDLQEILDIAKVVVEEDKNCFDYRTGNYNFFIWLEMTHDDEEIWVIEPNEVDEDGCSEPCGGWNKIVPYGDYAQLLIACAELAERYFKEE